MQIMELLKALPYVISGSICLVIGLILLFIKSPVDNRNDALPFKKIKLMISCSAFLDVLVDIITVVAVIDHFNIYLLDYMFIPVVYFMQLGMMTYALLGLIHSSLLNRKFWIYAAASVLGFFIIYICSFVIYAINIESSYRFMDSYRLFVQTKHAEFFHIVMFCITAVCMILCFVALFIHTRRYDTGLVNLHSGRNVTEGRKFEFIIYTFICYFLLAALDFLWPDDVANAIIILVNTAIFVAFFIAIMSLRDVYYNVSSIKNYSDSFHMMSSEIDESPSIREKIQIWKNSEDKVWLNEGLTLTTVASQMKIKPRLLSGYINDIMGMNFNKWICTLRIEEAQKMIKEHPDKSISEIAFSTGFSDTSALSRTFKSITGLSPSEYKKKVSK